MKHSTANRIEREIARLLWKRRDLLELDCIEDANEVQDTIDKLSAELSLAEDEEA